MTVSEDCLPYAKTRRVCDRCGNQLRGRQSRWCSVGCRTWYYVNHVWSFARAFALADQGRACTRCGEISPPEVDHISPRNGQPMAVHSCLHHQTNLRVLCHHCHVTRRDWDV